MRFNNNNTYATSTLTTTTTTTTTTTNNNNNNNNNNINTRGLARSQGSEGPRAVTLALAMALCGARGACAGAWLGAFPLPLDWDGQMQIFPLPNLLGACAGFLAGLVFAVVGLWLQTKEHAL
jgi:hypothetical protein